MGTTSQLVLTFLIWLGIIFFFTSDLFWNMVEADNIYDEATADIIGMDYILNEDTLIIVDFTGGVNKTFTLSNGVEISDKLVLDSNGIKSEILTLNKLNNKIKKN